MSTKLTIYLYGLFFAVKSCFISLLNTTLPFETLNLLPSLALRNIGYYSGILNSVVEVGSLVGSILLVQLCYKFGRRTVTNIGIASFCKSIIFLDV